LIGNPEVIILDEPFANLDPTSVNRLKVLKELAENKDITILVFMIYNTLWRFVIE
jgi:ABC-2 type transport system ATP-binding protein